MKSDDEKMKERFDRFFSRLEKRLDEDEGTKRKGFFALIAEIIFLSTAAVICVALLTLVKALKLSVPIALAVVVAYFAWTWADGWANRDAVQLQTQSIVQEETLEPSANVQVEPIVEGQ